MTLRWLVIGLGILVVASCTIVEGPPQAEASTEAEVILEPGESRTLRFEVEAEAIGETTRVSASASANPHSASSPNSVSPSNGHGRSGTAERETTGESGSQSTPESFLSATST